MYSKYQREKALQLYDQCKSVSKVIKQLGYPSRKRLYDWMAQRNAKKNKKVHRKKYNNTPEHPRNPPLDLKLEVIKRCFEMGENVQLVSEEIGYSRASIYTWRKKYILKEAAGLMNAKDYPRGKLSEGNPVSSKEIEQLKTQIHDMQLEIDILKETLDVLKKDPGADITSLKNRERAVIIVALKNKYPLPLLLQELNISRSSYYYK